MFADALLEDRFELLCNTCSLGEMKNRVIRHWMDFIQNRLDVRYFYSFNRFLNTIDLEKYAWRLDENVCSVSWDDRWRILQWELQPPFARCPYHETFATRNVQIVAERLPTTVYNKSYNIHLSKQIAANVAHEDWFIHSGKENLSSMRDSLLSHDLTMGGTLFSLWESICLDSREDNVSMMLIYLSCLMRDKPFEEMFYYFKLLETFRRSRSRDKRQAFISLGARQKKLIELIKRGVLGRCPKTDWPPQLQEVIGPSIHKLVEEDYKGFSIVRYRNNFYALAHCLGPMNLREVEESSLAECQESGLCLVRNSVDELKQTLDRSGLRGAPQLVEKDYKGFNIVHFGRKYYALALKLGSVELTHVDENTLREYQKRSMCVIGDTAIEVKDIVARVFAASSTLLH